MKLTLQIPPKKLGASDDRAAVRGNEPSPGSTSVPLSPHGGSTGNLIRQRGEGKGGSQEAVAGLVRNTESVLESLKSPKHQPRNAPMVMLTSGCSIGPSTMVGQMVASLQCGSVTWNYFASISVASWGESQPTSSMLSSTSCMFVRFSGHNAKAGKPPRPDAWHLLRHKIKGSTLCQSPQCQRERSEAKPKSPGVGEFSSS